MTTTATYTTELNDIKTHFYAIVEKYAEVYANYKVNPNLPSAMNDHAKMESNLTSVYRRMFAFQSGIDKEMEQYEAGLNQLTNQNSNLNVMLERGTASTAMPSVQESFVTITGLGTDDVPTPNQISMVSEARSIEKTAYYYSIGRIIYLLVGITIVSYFIFQTVAGPDSTILADAKMKAEQLRNTIVQQQQQPNPAV